MLKKKLRINQQIASQEEGSLSVEAILPSSAHMPNSDLFTASEFAYYDPINNCWYF